MSEDLVKIAVLEQRVQDLKEIVLKIDDAIEKISQVNINLTKMIAVHDEKLDTREKSERDVNDKIDNIYKKMKDDHENVLGEIKKVNTTLTKVEENVDVRLSDIEKEQARVNLKLAVVVGGAALIAFIIQNSEFFAKVLSEEEKHLTTPPYPAKMHLKSP